MEEKNSVDNETAQAFAQSWNNLPVGSIYTKEQFEEWMAPLERKDVEGKRVLELGCGNASLMYHLADWNPLYLEGVDLGDSVLSGENNMALASCKNWKIVKGDLVSYQSQGFDLVYSIGVLHHLKEPVRGFDSVIRNTKKGGSFHCWVYAKEGNAMIIYLVDPIRKIVCHLPWWFIKYFIATPLVFPYFIYAKFLNYFKDVKIFQKLPFYQYSLWIAQRSFSFFRHVAFDQLVTPQTTYIEKKTIENWLASKNEIDPASVYIVMRNGMSWKFGGKIKDNV